MLVRITPRRDTLYLSRGRTVMATGYDGTIAPGSSHGLFVHETRLVSVLRYFIDGQPPVATVISNVETHSMLGYYLVAAPGVDVGPRDLGSGMVPAESRQPLEMRVSRFAGDGLHEDIDFANFACDATRFTFEIELETDCSDIADLGHPVEIDRTVDVGYSRPPRFDGNRAVFEIELEPKATWHLCVDFAPSIDGVRMRPPRHKRVAAAVSAAVSGPAAEGGRRSTEALSIEVPGSGLTSTVHQTLEQARDDLAALRLPDLDSANGWTMAAGLPLYIALYGRDTLTAGWQAAMLGPEMMRGTLDVLARYQGKVVDDWRDEQPGRMLHEAHTGPLSKLNVNPRERSYGSVTTSGLYPFILAELWHWTGDADAVRPYVDNALAALEWLDRERQHDGLYTYQTRSSDGVKHQAWKDSPDAIVYEDGAPVEPPIATCEEQGFVFIAKLHFAETLWSLGMRDEARRLFDEALLLQRRFNEAFWMPEEGWYALGLDANGRQIRSIASNAGHCVATGIAADAHVPLIAERMFQPDLFTGWGVRTLSDKHPSYNPYSYHLGSVWPVEHGTFALGFMRYGLHERAQQLAKGMFEAAALFDFHRLPELFTGHPRDDAHPFPALYPNANSPQAWSASAVFSLLQAMLGLYPYAPMKILMIDPHLPDWLPEITLRNLRVGEASVSIRFRGETYEVLDRVGTVHVIRQPMPWSLTATWRERLQDFLITLIK
jgi:glycogen debranching enzyme